MGDSERMEERRLVVAVAAERNIHTSEDCRAAVAACTSSAAARTYRGCRSSSAACSQGAFPADHPAVVHQQSWPALRLAAEAIRKTESSS